ncbi:MULTISPECIES: exodeoxyribonuclease VII small subunit [unclassified Psychrobacillus]|uniref:exodeoxyribonuclease VII small subunit n=1 Tax=unclassified Psychrobacillus TaxID=2636677 RepID=UPI00146C4A51|nr:MULTISPECIES: exodeoxyribonuclease VII small subunit [unclassified Psychrobacillus]MCM3359900.1 exodeoxyribonuclease VII small subunit [Psychrobacillus sp. MER TA 171]NME04380.1 exodeoxyribonuclease VII small subunit [Psychrobacillus sp. BL-248-WT-3]
MAKKEIPFDEAMLQLEQIVRQLEQGDVPLENAIELYQKGMELSKLCSDKLQSAEKQLVSFMGENKEEVGQNDE